MTETETNVSMDELRHLVRRERRSRWLVRILALLVVVAVVAFAIATAVLVRTTDQVRAVSDRSDCSRRYNSIISSFDRNMATKGWLQEDRLGTALFKNATTGQRATPDDIKNFGDGSTQLHTAVGDVQALPSIDHAVDRGFTLDHVHYPPCPKV